MKKYDLIVVGGGSGGLSAAAGAARLNLKTLLIEENKLGGDCLWNGCIPSKTLIHEAEKVMVMREEATVDEAVGLDMSKHFEEAKQRITQVTEEIAKQDSVKRFTGLGVDVAIGTAKFYSKNKVFVEANGKTEYFKFKKCILATGSRPKIPEMFKSICFVTNEQFFSLPELPKTLTVVGGGSIGVEMASAMLMFGVNVKIILRENFVMPKEEPEVQEFMTEKLKGMGAQVYPNANILKCFKLDGANCIELEGGTILKSDTVLVAVGRDFNTDLSPEKANIKLHENKCVLTDDYLKTTNKNVYAIGDCNGKLLFTHAAGYQAKAVLNNMLVPKFLKLFLLYRRFSKKAVPSAFPWVTYTYPEVAHVGAYTRDLVASGIYHQVFTTKLEHVDRAKTGGKETEGFIQVIVGKNGLFRKGGKILGVTIVAPHAGELITEWVLAKENNLPVEAIFNTIHAYPTLSELNPRGTFEYMSLKLTPFRTSILKVLFRFF